MKKKGYSCFNEFYKVIERNPEHMAEFLDRMTINVSEFFRNYKRWEVLENKILPRLIQGSGQTAEYKGGKKKLKVWSAACSTGEEPYTLAMMLSNHIPLSHITIQATDIDYNALQRAKNGIYPERSLNEVPQHFKEKFFSQEGALFRVNEKIKNTVTFSKQNLLADQFDTDFDLIVCRKCFNLFYRRSKTYFV